MPSSPLLPQFFPAVLAVALLSGSAAAAPLVSHTQNTSEVDPFDFVEVVLNVNGMAAGNPFTDVQVKGSFQLGNEQPVAADGFCDSPDGSLHRIRFMPGRPGTYTYSVTFQEGSTPQTLTGKFKVREAQKAGPLRVDKEHPFHFLIEGTNEHFFWNSTTAYWLLGWEDDAVIRAALDRLAALKINRVRVALCGRTHGGARWHEPSVVQTDKFKFRLNPWPAARPDSPDDPGFDVSRFHLPFWQKCERMVAHARSKNIIVSLIFYLDGKDKGVDPFGRAHAGSDDEKRYYRYAAARFAAFPNVVWDISNEYRFLRDDAWANAMGEYLKSCDPYDHLVSIHGHGDFHFRASGWADYCLYQSWDEHGGYEFMLKNRQEQTATGQPKPQINEEYGYEDHYPQGWGENRTAPARNADSRRRLAWQISMAGGYQTTGERADQGCGKPPDTGGGWLTGRGDDAMTMLHGYARMAEFFRSFEWWKAEPREDLVQGKSALCLADPGQTYALYFPSGGATTVKLEAGKYAAKWHNPRTGESSDAGQADGPAEWKSPNAPTGEDWALLLRKQ
jgi:hypothetical protein